MKKPIALLLTVMMCLSLAACGTNTSTSESAPDKTEAQTEITVDTDSGESQLSAEELDFEVPEQLFDTAMENQARAMLNPHLLLCTVGRIASTYFECKEKANIHVGLSREQLAQLNAGDEVAVYGMISDIYDEETTPGFYTTIISFEEAQLYNEELPSLETMEYYLEKDYQEATGLMANHKYSSAWDILDSLLAKVDSYKDSADLLLECSLRGSHGYDYLKEHRDDYKPLYDDELKAELLSATWSTSDENWHFYEDGTLDPGRVKPIDGSKVILTWSVEGDVLYTGIDDTMNSCHMAEVYDGALIGFTDEGKVFHVFLKAE